MKNLSSYLLFVIVLGGGLNLSAQENVGLLKVVSEYVDIKEALVADDYSEVKAEVPALKAALADASIQDEKRRKLGEAIDELAVAGDLKEQREAFTALSSLLIEVVEEEDIEKTLYVQHCPMALDGGASWLSYQEEVRNPYMGQRMPGCGSVKEKL